jgi:hypothetical protein
LVEILRGKKLFINIDGDKTNNEIENLHLCPTMSDHRDLHNNLEQVAFEIVKLGLIEFDKETSTYKIAPSLGDKRMESGEFRERLRPKKDKVTLSQVLYGKSSPNGKGATTIRKWSRVQVNSKRPTSQLYEMMI